jgi:hypothetical protein
VMIGLNEMGEGGWELVGVVPQGTELNLFAAIFKRARTDA